MLLVVLYYFLFFFIYWRNRNIKDIDIARIKQLVIIAFLCKPPLYRMVI